MLEKRASCPPLAILCVFFALLLGVAVAQIPTYVVAQNHNPSFVPGPGVTVQEDCGQYKVVWATGITDNDGGVQSLSFTLKAANTALFSTQPEIDSTSGLLTFVPATDAYGASLVEVVLIDGGTDDCVLGGTITACPAGCQPTKCSNSKTLTFTITVVAVNDCPTFQNAGAITRNEDADTQYVTNWATVISRGATNEATQTLKFTVNNNNNALFSTQPYITYASGTTASMVFRSCDNCWGTATITVVLTDNGGTDSGGCDTSQIVTTTIKIQAVNDAPYYTAGANPVQVNEDSGPYSQLWATGISVGAPYESQHVQFQLQLVNAAQSKLFSVQPTMSQGGTLSFTPAPNYNTYTSSVQMYVQITDDDSTNPLSSCSPITSCPTITIIINPVNDVPSFTKGQDVYVYEDLLQLASPPTPLTYSIANWAKDITAGNSIEDGDEGQTVSFTVTTSDDTLFSAIPSLDATGTLRFTLAPNQNGDAHVYVTIWDSLALSGATQEFLVSVAPVNDAPSYQFVVSNPLTIPMSAGYVEYINFLKNIGAGPATADDETKQSLWFEVTTVPSNVWTVFPQVTFVDSSTAKIRFQVKDGESGEILIYITLRDDGGTDRGGVDMYTQVFHLQVEWTNTAPTFDLSTNQVVVVEDACNSGYTQIGLAIHVLPGNSTAGVKEAATQTVTFVLSTDNPTLFATLPAVSSSGALSFTTKPDMWGTTTVTITAWDNAAVPLASAVQSFCD